MCSFSIFSMSVLEQISNGFVQTYIGLHFFHKQNLYYWYFFITELNFNMPYSCTSGIKFALIEVIRNRMRRSIMKNNKENVILCHNWPFYVQKLPHKYN